MRVPLLDLQAQHAEIGTEIEDAVRRVLHSGRYIMGEDVFALEREVAEDLGIAHAVGVSAGTDALLATLRALGVGPGDEVVTTRADVLRDRRRWRRGWARARCSPTSTTRRCASIPAAAAAAVTARTRAIDPGPPVRPAGGSRLGGAVRGGRGRGPGAGRGRRRSGAPAAGRSLLPDRRTWARSATPARCSTDDDELADRRRAGSAPTARGRSTTTAIVGGNFRLDALQAAILRAKLRARWPAGPRRGAPTPRATASCSRRHGSRPSSACPAPHPRTCGTSSSCARPRRDALRAHLAAAGVGTEVYYPVPLHLQPCFADLGGREGDLPEAEKAAREVLALPVHANLSEAQLGHVASSMRAFYACDVARVLGGRCCRHDRCRTNVVRELDRGPRVLDRKPATGEHVLVDLGVEVGKPVGELDLTPVSV